MENHIPFLDDTAPLPMEGEPVFLLRKPRANVFSPQTATGKWFVEGQVPAELQRVPAMAFVPDVPVVPSAPSLRYRRLAARLIGVIAIIGSIVFLAHVGKRASARSQLLQWGTMGQSHVHAR